MLYSSNYSFILAVFVNYILGILFLRFVLKNRQISVFYIYSFFSSIYLLLILFTHIELIKDPFIDFFVHNDSSRSFYTSIMGYVLPCSWTDILPFTVFNPYFADYPFAAYLWSTIGKIGMSVGIEDLRLLMRLPSALVGSLTVSISAMYFLHKKMLNRNIIKYSILLGLCTYLYITSAIMSRDVFLTFFMTLAIYFYMINNTKYIPFIVFIGFIALGFRTINGLCIMLIAIIPILHKIYNKSKFFSILLFLLLALIIFGNSLVFSEQIQLYQTYQLHNATINKGGLFYYFYTLPFPFDKLSMAVYMLLQPLPMTFYVLGDGNTWLNLPEIISPYIIVYMVGVLLYLLKGKNGFDERIKILTIILILIYIMIISGSPDIRRAFFVMPGLYMIFCTNKEICPKMTRKTIKRRIWIFLICINIFFLFYTMKYI